MSLIKRIFFSSLPITLLLGSFIVACSNAKNYNEAYKVKANGKKYLKLYGERNYMAHDPFSVGSNNTYKDSLLIEVPSFEDGIISGASITVKAGKYNYSGDIIIES